MKAVDADGGLAEVDLLDTQVGQWADYGFAALLMQTAHQDHIAAGLFQQMGDIGADGDPRDLFTLGQIARQQGVGAAAFDKNGLSVTEQEAVSAASYCFRVKLIIMRVSSSPLSRATVKPCTRLR